MCTDINEDVTFFMLSAVKSLPNPFEWKKLVKVIFFSKVFL